jgi:transposase
MAEHRGSPYGNDIVQQALRLIALRVEYPNNCNLSDSSIARIVGVKSHETISNWAKKPMDPVSVYHRQMDKGHNRIFSFQDEFIFAGWILDSGKSHHPTTTSDLMDFVEKHFHVRLSPSWISRFLSRQHLSHLKPSSILYHESLNAHAELVKWITTVREILKDKKPHQVFIYLLYLFIHSFNCIESPP